MPEWWLEAMLPGITFTLLFIIWIVLPSRPEESDIGSKIRRFFKGDKND